MRLWRFRRRVSKLRKQTASAERNEHLSAYLGAAASLEIEHIQNTAMIAVDLELTGLDPATEQIIAIGWTCIDGGRIQLKHNRHFLLQATRSVGDSALIHELVDSDLRGGGSQEAALKELLQAAQGRVWIFHHAGLDTAFLKKACLEHFGCSLPFAVLDTLQLERGLRNRRDIPIKKNDLQLGALRSHYGLPEYTAHNALTDAYATAELFLAMAAKMSRNKPLELKPYVQYT